MDFKPATKMLSTCRTMADVQRRPVRWGKRNEAPRHFHAKSDEETVANWKYSHQVNDLDYKWVWYLASASSAPEESPPLLPRSTHGTVSDDDVTKTHTVVSKVQRDVAGACATFSDIRSNTLRSQEVVDSQNSI